MERKNEGRKKEEGKDNMKLVDSVDKKRRRNEMERAISERRKREAGMELQN